VGVVLIVSALDRWAGGVIVADWHWAAGVTAGVAALMGVPCALWLIERRQHQPTLFIGLGACVGALPLLGALVSGMIGRLARGGTAWLAEFMAHSAPLPIIGATTWPTFFQWEFRNILIGAISGVVFWSLVVRRARKV
jgi:hypothetical protein